MITIDHYLLIIDSNSEKEMKNSIPKMKYSVILLMYLFN